jgi:cell division protein FtsB
VKRILNIIKNKYVIITVAFFVWILVFDKNNILSQIELAKKLRQIKTDRTYYIQQIKEDSIETKELMTNPANLERFAREKYLMKRDSEDIFLIVREDTVVQPKK